MGMASTLSDEICINVPEKRDIYLKGPRKQELCEVLAYEYAHCNVESPSNGIQEEKQAVNFYQSVENASLLEFVDSKKDKDALSPRESASRSVKSKKAKKAKKKDKDKKKLKHYKKEKED